MNDLATWVQNGLISLAALGSCVAYIHNRTDALRKRSEEDLGKMKTELEQAISSERAEREEHISIERSERRREIDRVGKAIEALAGVPGAIALVAQSVDNLGKRFDDNKAEQSRASDEVKHAVRGLDQKLTALAVGGRTHG